MALPAAAIDSGPLSLEILVDGQPLSEHAARGTTYIEAAEGREYSIRLRNHTGSRIAVALSVDGLNTIDARTTSAPDAAKWILDPYQAVTLDGWQTGSSTARRFFFTSEGRSYGNWLGRTANLGLVAAVAFREKSRPIAWRDERRSSVGPSEKAASPAPAADASEGAGGLSEEMAATGIGREVDHRVQRVRFEAEASPAASVELRYEFRDALVRLGVLPPPHARCDEPLARRERARGFHDLAFAPDPYDPGRR
jgi:hypothetical protein